VVSATDPYGRILDFLGRRKMAMRKRVRIWRILTIVYNTQDYWVSGLCPSSGILNAREHNVSETGPVSETLFFIVFRIRDDGQSPQIQ
jgi:hypothetical protein